MFESFHQGKISIEKIVKMCHNPAKIFKIEKRGFIKEGYYADLVIVNSGLPCVKKRIYLLNADGLHLKGLLSNQELHILL
jgi:dihydroorotase